MTWEISRLRWHCWRILSRGRSMRTLLCCLNSNEFRCSWFQKQSMTGLCTSCWWCSRWSRKIKQRLSYNKIFFTSNLLCSWRREPSTFQRDHQFRSRSKHHPQASPESAWDFRWQIWKFKLSEAKSKLIQNFHFNLTDSKQSSDVIATSWFSWWLSLESFFANHACQTIFHIGSLDRGQFHSECRQPCGKVGASRSFGSHRTAS